MSEVIAREAFQSRIDYLALPSDSLIEQFHRTRQAYHRFFALWQTAITQELGEHRREELTPKIYPNLEALSGDLDQQFYEDLRFTVEILPAIQSMLTFAEFREGLLPADISESSDLASMDKHALLLLWNAATLTYVMQTRRWTDLLINEEGKTRALEIEKKVWVDYGGAEEDLLVGLDAAGQRKGDVETLLRGFQFAPGEVGLVDAEFTLENANHGWITHRRCPAHAVMVDSDKERLENSCVICVIAMRLSGEMVNERIRCRAASLPPHRETSDHACRWEYWIPGA